MFDWTLAALMMQAGVSGQAAIPSTDIIVRGERAETALGKCLQRGCGVPDDVRLTMALAEAQFGQGRYREALASLHRSIDRTKGDVARYPRQISALYEATATINRHIGDLEAHRSAVVAQSRILKDNLPPDDPQRRQLRLAQGDSWVERGNIRKALSLYDSAQAEYEAAGDQFLVSLAGLRRVAMMLALGDKDGARRIFARLPNLADPVIDPVRTALAARLAKESGDNESVDRLIASLRTEPSLTPILIEEPTLDEVARTPSGVENGPGALPVNLSGASDAAPIRWVDISYLIRADGRVADVEVRRGKGGLEWVAPYVAQIRQRRYAPIAVPEGQPGVYQLERLTRRARIIVPTGSFVRRGSGAVTVERQNLTWRGPEPASTAATGPLD